MRRAAAGAALFVLVPLLGACRGGDMTDFRFVKDAESLQSLATEGSMLADGVVDSRTTTAFVITHAQDLAAEAEQLASVVASTDPEPGLDQKTEELARLANLVASQLRELSDSASDEETAAAVRSSLANAADEAVKLEEGV
jgi:alkylhydroperoxidase/carboxymuconolactone decarboxylase family protein YurZ